MVVAATILWALAQLYLLVLIARMVISLVMAFARDWRPRGAAAVVSEVIFTLTDPPIKLARRLIPPLRLGGMALDLGFMLVVILVSGVAYGATWLM
jgi:YggT family protein